VCMCVYHAFSVCYSSSKKTPLGWVVVPLVYFSCKRASPFFLISYYY
jgi:DNA/RNA endonuclease G (NUC1)